MEIHAITFCVTRVCSNLSKRLARSSNGRSEGGSLPGSSPGNWNEFRKQRRVIVVERKRRF